MWRHTSAHLEGLVQDALGGHVERGGGAAGGLHPRHCPSPVRVLRHTVQRCHSKFPVGSWKRVARQDFAVQQLPAQAFAV